MGNTSPWAATNRRASLLSLDKLQAASVKPQATSFKRQAATFRALNQELAVVIWSQQQKGNLCQNLHLSLTTKNSKWRTRSTSTVYRTTRWAQPTNISTFLKALGSVHVMAAQLTLGSGTEETSSINITAPIQLGPSSIPSHPEAASFKRQASQGASGKRQAPSSKHQASSRKLQAPGPCVLHKVSRS